MVGSCAGGNEIRPKPVTPPVTAPVPSFTPTSPAPFEVEWTKEIDTGNPTGVLATVRDTLGNFFVVYSDGLKLGGSFVSKYGREFDMLWRTRSNTEFPLSLACDNETVYVSGFLLGGTAGGKKALQTYLNKYSSVDGNEIWTRFFTTGGTEGACFLAIDSGYVYVAGEKYTYSSTPPSKIESFVRKLDAAGKDVWVSEMLPYFEPKAIAVVTGEIYVAGSVRGGSSDRPRGQDAFVMKYDFDGNEKWLREFGPGRVDALAADAKGVYTISYLSQSAQVIHAGYFLRKFTPGGDQVWTQPIPFTPYNVRLYADEVYVMGEAVSPGWNTAGGKDAILRKYDDEGNGVWDFMFGTSLDEEAKDIAFDGGLLYVLGEASGPKTHAPVPFDGYMSRLHPK